MAACDFCDEIDDPTLECIWIDDDDDADWVRWRAMELGMGLGIEAYNDAMGWGS